MKPSALELTTENPFSDEEHGNFAEVLGFCGDPLIIERLKELGIHRGVKIEAYGRAPFGGPKLYRLGATVLALREEEAECIRIQKL
jgi:Fe2+ transport system protein FeoA